jgi:hypothetical protein
VCSSDLSERVYLTGRSAYPEAWQGGVYRRLGVPAPGSKPLCSVIVNDEFDPGDAAGATEQATLAVIAAVKATATDVLMGNAVPASLVPSGPTHDPLADKVQLHLDFNALDGGQYKDKSPQRRSVLIDGTVPLLTDNTGPLGATGAGCANFTNTGHLNVAYIDRKRDLPDPTWTVEAWIKPTENLEFLTLFARNGGLREITFRVLGMPDAEGSYRTLTASDFGGGFTNILTCKRPDGSHAAPAGVETHVVVQANGSWIEVYLDGAYCGRTPGMEHLEIHRVGSSWYTAAQRFRGKVDELRVTFAARYSGAFTRPTAPYPTALVPNGILVAHGAIPGLPTASSEDAAYLVQLTASGGGWVAANPAEEYLRSLGGGQVSYLGLQYWAVLISGWRATGKTTSEAAIDAALDVLVNPADPPNLLLTGPQVALLAPLLWGLYDPAVSPVAPLVAGINSGQSALLAQIGTTPPSSTETGNKLSLLTSASGSLEAYFAGLDARIRAVLTANASEIFGSINSQVVTRNVETRAYVFTYVTDWGEESAPSPASDLLTLDQNDHVSVAIAAPPAGRNVVGWRLYRSSTSNNGAAFQLVEDTLAGNAVLQNGAFAHYAVNNLSLTDTKAQEELQEELVTALWAEPPSNLKGLVGLPNGILAGFFDKTICFSHPYAPYAWPVEHQQTVGWKIVGLGVIGQTLVVLTEGLPSYFSGADSASMSGQVVETPQACIAKRTIANVEGGVMYASPDGLCLATLSGVQLLTQGAFTKADWLAQLGAAPFGAYSDGSYYLFTGVE